MKAIESRSDLAIKLAVCLAMIASLFGCSGVRTLTQGSRPRPAAEVRRNSESVFHRPVL